MGEAEMAGNKYTLRELKSVDVAPALKIISKLGIKQLRENIRTDEIKTIIDRVKKANGDDAENDMEKELESLGVGIMLDIADVLIYNIAECETEVFGFLSGLSGMTVEEIANLPLEVFTEMILDVTRLSGFKGFIRVVSKFAKKTQ